MNETETKEKKERNERLFLLAWIQAEVYIWCKHQAYLHHRTSKKVICGGQVGSEKSHSFFPC